MPMAFNHIIHKVSLDITIKNKEQAYAIKDNISAFLAKEVFPELELYLEQLQKETEQFAIRLEEVSLDLSFTKLTLNTMLREEIITTFKQQVKNLLANQEHEQTLNKVKKLNNATVSKERIFNSIEINRKPSKNNKKQSPPQFFTQTQHQLASLVHFIEHGSSPWWQGEDSITMLLESTILHSLISIPFFKTELTKLLPLKKVQKRLLYQFSATHLFSIIGLFISDSTAKKLIEHIRIDDFSNLSKTQKDAFFLIIFSRIQQQKDIDVETLLAIAKELSFTISMFLDKTILKKSTKILDYINWTKNNAQHRDYNTTIKSINTKQKSIEKKSPDQKINNSNRKKPIHHDYNEKIIEEHNFSNITTDLNIDLTAVQQENNKLPSIEDQFHTIEKELLIKNAGLVLAHPFLPTLFKHCKLLDTQKQITNPVLAVHILHYLATGNTQQAESDLFFEKYLCNIPFEMPIPRFITLSDEHVKHVHKLLDAIKQNWNAMRTSSNGLLQNEFLQRSGKLTFKNDTITVAIERKTHDILLNKISWGISLVNLPWKKRFIYVHWN